MVKYKNMEKVCASRPSKKYPNVWTKEEIVDKAVKKLGMTVTKARQLSKMELCKKLGLSIAGAEAPKGKAVTPKGKAVAPKGKAVTPKGKAVTPKGKAVAAPHGPNGTKICTTKRNIKNRYSRADLEKAALALGKTAKEIRGLKYEDLCALLKYPTQKPAAAVAPAAIVGNCIERSSKALRDHQKAVLQYMDKHRGLIVYHKVGSGKTLTAISVSQCYLDKNPTHRVMVIAPAGLIHNFKDEMTKSYVNLKFPERYEFYSYQKFTSLVKKNKKPMCQNTLVIIDEGHNLKNPKGINAKNVLSCTEKANKVLILTGTPLYNSKNDIFTLYNMIRDKGTPEIPKSAYDNSFPVLKCKISYHDTSNDPNFPKRIDTDQPIIMTPAYKAKYLQVVESAYNGDIENAFVRNMFGKKNLGVFYNALRRAVNNLDNSAANRKLDWLVDKLKSFPSHEKVIVFSNFLEAGLRLVTSKLPATIPYAVIEGKVSMNNRRQIVDDFNKGKYQVLFISKAGGEGLDMKGVRHVILMEPTWNEASNEQVIGRAIRYKSHVDLPANQQNVTVHRLLHIFPEDVALLPYLQNPTNAPEISPGDNSMDLFLSLFERKKQIEINKYNALLQSYSIEKNSC